MAHEREREALKRVYPSRKWYARVNGFTDDQVIAVYLRLRQQKKL